MEIKHSPQMQSQSQCTVRFNGNGNWNTSQGSYTQQFTYDLPATLTPNKFTRPDNTTYNSVNYIKGYEFIGWGTSATQTTATYTDKQEVKNLKIDTRSSIRFICYLEETNYPHFWI